MQEQIQALLETVTMNIGYPVFPQNLELLLDHTFYFQICSIIFPEFRIRMFKISQDSSMSPAQKIQQLLELLTAQLQINLSALSGQEILKGHFIHLYKFLNVLKEFSQLPPSQSILPKSRHHQRLKSFPMQFQIQKNTKQSQSARVQINRRIQSLEKSIESLSNSFMHSGVDKNKQIEVAQIDKNIGNINQKIGEVVVAVQQNNQKNIDKNQEKKNEKRKILKKITIKGLSQISQKKVNKKYKSYLLNLMKAQKGKRKNEKNETRPKSVRMSGLKKEIKEIDDFFKSFEFKIRDQKNKYLRKMKQIIRDQENQRLRIQQRISLQRAKGMMEREKKAISSLTSTHNIKKEAAKEKYEKTKQAICLQKKQRQRNLRDSKRQLKETKKEEIKQIKNYITQMNNKILMKFQQDGEFQKFIMGLYKKY